MATKKLQQPAEPAAPKPMTDEQLTRARPDQIEQRIAEHAAAAARIDAAADPGVVGLPGKEAALVRKRQLEQLHLHDREIERLRDWQKLTAPEALEEQGRRERFESWRKRGQARARPRGPGIRERFVREPAAQSSRTGGAGEARRVERTSLASA
jgi:hypothetical protein